MKQLATGSIADVLLARASGLEGFARHVVIKRIRPDLAGEDRFVESFLEEARIAASLHHQNVVQVHDIGDEGGSIYFAMEYVHGEDCRKLLNRVRERGEMVPLQHVVAIIMATAAGLHYAHEQATPTGESKGIVHRDVSPANILIGYDGSVKLVDFGLARAASRSTNATASGTARGKSSYMSPEQCTGKQLDRRTDTFSLGIVLFELLTAQRLFKGINEFMTMAAIVDGEIPRPSTLRADVPPALDEICLRALSRSTDARYQTAETLRESLEAFAVAQELRMSHKALADYMVSLFGERPEPWLAERAPDPAWESVEATHAGLVANPRDPRQLLATLANDADAPIAQAAALGTHEWSEDEQIATAGQLPSLRKLARETAPAQSSPPAPAAGSSASRTADAITVAAKKLELPTEPVRNIEAPTEPVRNVEAPTVPVRNLEAPTEPVRHVGDITATQAEPTATLRKQKLVAVPDTTATGSPLEVTQTQPERIVAAPIRGPEDVGGATVIEPPIFDGSLQPTIPEDDHGLDEDEAATEIALDVASHAVAMQQGGVAKAADAPKVGAAKVADAPKASAARAADAPKASALKAADAPAARATSQGAAPAAHGASHAAMVAPGPQSASHAAMPPPGPQSASHAAMPPPGPQSASHAAMPAPLAVSPQASSPSYPQAAGPAFAGVDPVAVAAGFHAVPARSSTDAMYQGPPAPPASLGERVLRFVAGHRTSVLIAGSAALLLVTILAMRGCGSSSTPAASAVPPDAGSQSADDDRNTARDADATEPRASDALDAGTSSPATPGKRPTPPRRSGTKRAKATTAR